MSVFIAISVVDTFSLRNQFETLLTQYILKPQGLRWSLMHYEFGCRLLPWLSTTSQVCSSYFVLLFTLERFISVRFPLKRASICTKRRINIAIFGIVVIAGLMSSFALYFYRIHRARGTTHCLIIQEERTEG